MENTKRRNVRRDGPPGTRRNVRQHNLRESEDVHVAAPTHSVSRQ